MIDASHTLVSELRRVDAALSASLTRERDLAESLDRTLTVLSRIAVGNVPLKDVMTLAMERASFELNRGNV